MPPVKCIHAFLGFKEIPLSHECSLHTFPCRNGRINGMELRHKGTTPLSRADERVDEMSATPRCTNNPSNGLWFICHCLLTSPKSASAFYCDLIPTAPCLSTFGIWPGRKSFPGRRDAHPKSNYFAVRFPRGIGLNNQKNSGSDGVSEPDFL